MRDEENAVFCIFANFEKILQNADKLMWGLEIRCLRIFVNTAASFRRSMDLKKS